MEYPSFGPETALALLHALLYSMACVLAGAALIAFSITVPCCALKYSFPNLVRGPAS
jgi:hypothetical protein